jgi:hypothetical protein
MPETAQIGYRGFMHRSTPETSVEILPVTVSEATAVRREIGVDSDNESPNLVKLRPIPGEFN